MPQVRGALEMPFERSLEIERRLDDVLRLIRTGRYSTPMLAEEVGVSIPTVSRIVAALRDRGHAIEAERTRSGWRYVRKARSALAQRAANNGHAARSTR